MDPCVVIFNIDILSTAEFCLVQLLLKRHPNMLFHHFIESVFHFNAYDKHNGELQILNLVYLLSNLCNLLHTRQSLYNLRSTSAVVLNAPRSRTNVGSKAFAATGPKCWNRLPQSVRLANSLSSFKSQLKTHLYPKLL